MISYGGMNLFGAAVIFQQVTNPTALQALSVKDMTGKIFMISGVLVGLTISEVESATTAFNTFADGVGRTLVDHRGREWTNVAYKGEFFTDPDGPRKWLDGYRLSYTAIFRELT